MPPKSQSMRTLGGKMATSNEYLEDLLKTIIKRLDELEDTVGSRLDRLEDSLRDEINKDK